VRSHATFLAPARSIAGQAVTACATYSFRSFAPGKMHRLAGVPRASWVSRAGKAMSGSGQDFGAAEYSAFRDSREASILFA
jgi:hypothetical protein